MLEINGNDLRGKLEKPYSDIYDEMETYWEVLTSRFNLKDGGHIKVDLKSNYLINKQISSPSGDEYTKTVGFPAGVAVPTRAYIYIDGIKTEIRYYERKKMEGKDRNIIIYEPNVIMFRNPRILTKNDRDLIMFLYMFSNRIEDNPRTSLYTIENNHMSNMFYFYDEVKEAKTNNDYELKAAKARILVSETPEKALRRFALTQDMNLLKANKEVLINKINTKIIENIKSDNGTYEKLIEYLSEYVDTNIDLESAVLDGISIEFIENKRQNLKFSKKVYWRYSTDKLGFYTQEDSSDPNTEAVIAFLQSNAAERERFLERYEKYKAL